MSVIIRVIYEDITYDLDIESQSPIRLDVSAIENTEIGEFFGVGSQNFTLPGTKTNNSFFKHAYNIGADDVPAFSNTIDGMIVSNSQTILKGQLQLIEVIKDEKGYVNYKCTMTDEVVQFKDAIQNKLIKDADWSQYTHTLDTGSIIDSWSNNLLNGDVFYPLADYGIDDPENQGNFPLYGFSNGGVGNYFDNPLTPIKPQQFLPAVRAKAVLDLIAAQAGFSTSGDFINSGNFSNLMILPKGQEEMGIVVSGSEQPTGYAINDYNQVLSAQSGPAIGEKLAANTIVVDPVGKFNVSGSQGYVYYEADGVGTYEAAAQIGFFNPMSFSQGEVQVDLKLVRGSFPFSSTVIATQTNSFKSTDGFQTFTMNVGGSWNSSTSEDVWVYVDYYQLSGVPSPYTNLNLIGFSSKLEVTVAPANFVGATVDMSLQFPSDLKSIDILTGLIKQFNLIVYPHETEDRTIVFEQFDKWIREGERKDWTDKWDTAERVAINHTVDEEPAELLFSNADDNDRFSVEAKESEPYYQYGTLRVLADNNVSQGKQEIKNSFAPVVLGGPFIYDSEKADGTPTYNIDLGSSFGFPHLYKFDNNGLKSYKFKPRLGYKVNNSLPSGSQIVIGNDASDKTILSGFDRVGTIANVNGLAARDGDADLHFNNTYFKFVGPGLNLGNTESNFDVYWKTYIDSLYWDGNRKVTLDILFSADEYKDIKLNDIIFIKDQQYRINKISGLNVVKDDVVTVELIRLFPAYYQNNPDCDFSVNATQLDCDFTFEAIAGLSPTPTPSPTPLPTCNQYRVQLNQTTASVQVDWTCCFTNTSKSATMTRGYGVEDTTNDTIAFTSPTAPVITEIKPDILPPLYNEYQYGIISASYDTIEFTETETFSINPDKAGRPNAAIRYYNSFIDTGSCGWNCDEYFESGIVQDITIISGSLRTLQYNDTKLQETLIGSGSSICVAPPTPTPVPTATPTPTPTATAGPVTPTPTPVPTATPLPIFSYTGLADYSNYQGACSSSNEVTIYTRGEITSASIAYEDSAASNVFDFYRFFIDEATGIGYEFVDPNTTGQIIDLLDDACNVEVFNLYIDFNEYDACAESVTNIVYAEPGSTLSNGTILYEDINLEYSWYGQTSTEIKFIESGSNPRQIYYNTATGVSASGTDVCFTVNSFDGWDSTATTPPPAYCGDTDETFYVIDTPQVGDNIFTDADLTDYIFTGEKFVYNDGANELYVMSGSTGGDGSGWVIGEITSSYCTPATPTPSPTPAPIVTLFTASYAYSSWDNACNNPDGTGSLYHAQIWNGTAPAGYEEFIYEDASLTNIFDFYIYVVDTTTGLGYEMDDPNTTGKIFATQSQVCNPNTATIHYSFNQYQACAGTLTTTKFMDPGKNWGDSGVVLYDNFDRTQVFSPLANEFVSTSSLDRSIYEYSGGVLVDTGVDCYTSSFFRGEDYTSTSSPLPITCGDDSEIFYTQNAPQIGSVIYEDAAFTNPIFTGNNWVYNDTADELYHMSGSTGGDGSGWVIGEITSSVCTPPTTPTPTPNVQSYTMQRGYDAATQTCGTNFGQQTVYTNGPITTGSIMYDSSALTDNVDFYEYYRDINTDIVYESSTLTGEVIDVLGTGICATPTPTPSPTPTPTPTPTPSPTPSPGQWYTIEVKNCPSFGTTTYRNWFGDISTFCGYCSYYESSTDTCWEPFDLITYNSIYPLLPTNAVYPNCTTCLANT